MADPATSGPAVELAVLGFSDWFANNPIIAAILVGLLALFFFLYLLVRRTVMGFKEGMRGDDR